MQPCRQCGRMCVKTLPIFRGLSAEAFSKLQRLVVHRSIKKGELVVLQGDQVSNLYIIRSGQLKLVSTLKSGQEHILRTVNQGEFFGELSLLKQQRKSNYYAEAVTDTLLCSMDGEQLQRELISQPEVLYAMFSSLIERLSYTESMVHRLGMYDSLQKTAALLLSLAEKSGYTSSRGLIIDTELTRYDMASMVGLTQETFSRRLSDLRKQGLLITEGYKRIIIQRPEALAKILA